MPAWKAEVTVTPKREVADPQGQAIEKALGHLPSFSGGGPVIKGLRAGKVFNFTIEAADEGTASAAVEELANRVLANHNTEQFAFRLRSDA